MNDWSWKDPVQGSLSLRYEPGNWGDILKGEWLCHWLNWFRAQGNQQLRYRDPFCGGGDYPLSEATSRRLKQSPVPLYRACCQDGRLPSSATLVKREAERLGMQVSAHCSDSESNPLADLQGSDLLLFDPYDFFERWPEWTQALLDLGPEQNLVIYLYNKSPRGSSQFRHYQLLTERWSERNYLLGRLPADARLARAYHEVWMCGPCARDPQLAQGLRRLTLELHHSMAESGIWESHQP